MNRVECALWDGRHGFVRFFIFVHGHAVLILLIFLGMTFPTGFAILAARQVLSEPVLRAYNGEQPWKHSLKDVVKM